VTALVRRIFFRARGGSGEDHNRGRIEGNSRGDVSPMPKTSRPTLSASSISPSKWAMRSTPGLSETCAGSEIAAAKLSIPICIYVTSPNNFIGLIGVLRRYVES